MLKKSTPEETAGMKKSSFAQNARHRIGTSLDDVRSPLFWRAVVAEFLGTSFLVILGAGSCMVWDSDREQPPPDLHIAFAFGLAVASIVWAIGHLSGGHINPAVTAGFLVTRRISLVRAILFIIFQTLGAALGAGILLGITPELYRGGFGITLPHKDVGAGTALGVEFLITFVFVFTVFATSDEKRSDLNGSGPLAIGLTVTVCHLFALRYTGSSLNPARSFGIALATQVWKEHWVYWCGPAIGGVVAALLYDNVFASNASMDKAKEYLLASLYDPAKYPENPERPAKVTFADEVPSSSRER